jgi:hypothetical protein
MIDENAYGVLISYFGIEDEEYSSSREEFAERLAEFRGCCQDALEPLALGRAVRRLDLGHALYLEFPEDELPVDPLTWLRDVRIRLRESEFETVGVLTHGGRWLTEDDASPPEASLAESKPSFLPSEPLRHALDADSHARMTREDELTGWGPGLYVENEVIEALGKKLKNAPTALEACGATFYRLGS